MWYGIIVSKAVKGFKRPQSEFIPKTRKELAFKRDSTKNYKS